MQKINKECIIHLSEGKVEFILCSEISQGGVQVWAGIKAVRYFYLFNTKLAIFDSDYTVESLNNNEISFEINLDHLQRALKSGQYAHDIAIKLTKKNGNPFLSLVIQVQVLFFPFPGKS